MSEPYAKVIARKPRARRVLTDEDAECLVALRRLHTMTSMPKLAKQFNISIGTVQRVTWRAEKQPQRHVEVYCGVRLAAYKAEVARRNRK